MIQNRVLRLVKETKFQNGVVLPANQEIEVVMDVVYMGGYPLPKEFQSTILKWINENPTLLKDVTKNW